MYERIRNHIKSNGMNFRFVASRIGMSEHRFYRIMNGHAPLTVDEYETICREGLNVHPGYFFDQE